MALSEKCFTRDMATMLRGHTALSAAKLGVLAIEARASKVHDPNTGTAVSGFIVENPPED